MQTPLRIAFRHTERAREHEAHMDVYVALRDAFDSARRRLQDYEA